MRGYLLSGQLIGEQLECAQEHGNIHQGAVTTVSIVEPSATGIKMESSDQDFRL